MKSKVFIKGNYNHQQCYGFIEIKSRQEKTVYVKWKLFDNDTKSLIASLTRNYFLGDDPHFAKNIIDAVIETISKYRIGRTKVFNNIIIVPDDEI